MGKLSRIILIAFGSLVAFLAIVSLSVNLYVQSKATQAKIQHELSQRLGTPLQVRQISVTPWGGPKLSGITIPQTVGPGDFLKAETFQLRVRFFSLFRKRLVIKQVSFVEPTVVWQQNAEGKWRLPEMKEESGKARPIRPAPGTPQGKPETTTQETPTAEATTASVEPQTKLPEPPPEKSPSLVPEIQRINLKHGNFTFLDRVGKVVGNFEGVDFRSVLPSNISVRGNVKIAKASLRDRFFLKRLQSPFSYEPDVLDLSKISAEVGGGHIAGRFAIQPEAEDSPFTAGLNFRDVQADQIIVDAGGPKGMVQGKLEGNFEASGKTAGPASVTGHGAIFLRDGQVRQYSLLVALGQLLQIEELMQLHLQQAEAQYHITPGVINIDTLVLRSPNIRLSAKGTVTLAGKLKLDSRLAINDKIRGQLFNMVRDNFTPSSEPGYYALDFQVGGTIDRPKTNLMDRLVGRGLKDLFNEFMGTGKPKKKHGAPTETPTPEASPAMTPSSPPPTAAPTETSPTP